MKVLLDENLAHRLRTAGNDGIEVFLTGDQTLTYEQNLTGRTIAIVRRA